MRRAVLLLVLAITGCTLRDGPAPNRYGFQSSSTSALLPTERGPAVYTPGNDVTAPAAGISRVCMPQSTGVAADCRTF